MSLVTVSIAENGIADVRLNRPEKMNALSMDMFKAIIAAGESLARDKSVRVVVLSGEGRAFCAGLDLSMFMDPSGIQSAPLGKPEIGKAPNFYQKPGWVWKQLPVPVIAALHGVVYGGGLQIALGADIRFAHPEAQLSVMESKWGLVPDMSASQTLRDLVRLDVAKELTFTGRVVSGREAAELGLVTHVAEEPREAAFKLAEEMLTRSPDCLNYAKQLFEQSWRGSNEDGLLLEEALQVRLIGSHNQMESVMAGMQKRAPNFHERMDEGFAEVNPRDMLEPE